MHDIVQRLLSPCGRRFDKSAPVLELNKSTAKQAVLCATRPGLQGTLRRSFRSTNFNSTTASDLCLRVTTYFTLMAGGNTMRCSVKVSQSSLFSFFPTPAFLSSLNSLATAASLHTTASFLTPFDIAGYFSPPVEEYDYRSPVTEHHSS